MKNKNYRKIRNSYYDFSKAKNAYCNRAVVLLDDEEIVLGLGRVSNKYDNVIDVDSAVYLTLPSFLRLFDEMKSKLEDFSYRSEIGDYASDEDDTDEDIDDLEIDDDEERDDDDNNNNDDK